MKARLPLFALVIISPVPSLLADLEKEGHFSPEGSYAIEISLDNSPYTRLPIYRNAVTSLIIAGDTVVGGTTASNGLSPFLFAASLREQRLVQMVDIETVVPGQRALPTGFSRESKGTLLVGTLPQDVKGDGHLLRVEVTADGLRARDLGAPVPGEGVFALVLDTARGRLYGLTHPSGKFFEYDLAAGKTTVFEGTMLAGREQSAYRQFDLKPEQYLSRRLVLDGQGRVYGSLPMGRLFRFDPSSQAVETLAAGIPAIWGHGQIARLDSWAVAPDGSLYGGNAADGQIFRLNPATGAVQNLGKPILTPRIKAMSFAADGLLYGVAGGYPGYTHVFTYDPKNQSFQDYGIPGFEMVGEGLAPGTFWRGFQLSALAVSEEGHTIVMGDDEALSQIMVFPVGAPQAQPARRAPVSSRKAAPAPAP